LSTPSPPVADNLLATSKRPSSEETSDTSPTRNSRTSTRKLKPESSTSPTSRTCNSLSNQSHHRTRPWSLPSIFFVHPQPPPRFRLPSQHYAVPCVPKHHNWLRAKSAGPSEDRGLDHKSEGGHNQLRAIENPVQSGRTQEECGVTSQKNSLRRTTTYFMI